MLVSWIDNGDFQNYNLSCITHININSFLYSKSNVGFFSLNYYFRFIFTINLTNIDYNNNNNIEDKI